MLKRYFYLHNLVKTCPLECSCKAWRDCKWAAEIFAQGLDTSKIKKNVCDIPIKGVCCCGPEEKPPSMDKVRIVKIMAIPVVEFCHLWL